MDSQQKKFNILVAGLRTIQLDNGTSIALSQREIECLALYYHEHSYKDIGRILSMSQHTARHHINNVAKKLNCTLRSGFYRKMHDLHIEPLIQELYLAGAAVFLKKSTPRNV